MLYDPKWEKKDRVFDKVSLRDFVGWLETMPANETYNFTDPFGCALAQYLQARGCSMMESSIEFGPVPQPTDDGYWLAEIVRQQPQTFGGALKRARAALAAS